MRIPLAVSLESRNGSTTKDCKVVNGIIEGKGEDAPPVLRKRPGLIDLGLIHAGTAQLLTYWGGKIRAVIGDVLNILSGADSASFPGWTATTMPSAAIWGSVCWDGTNFVAVANSDTGTTTKAAYSSDGITWTASTLPFAANWNYVVAGGGKVVAIQNPGSGTTRAAVSSDHGVTWTETVMPSSQQWAGLAYSSTLGRFVATVNNGTASAYSTDGTTWVAGGALTNSSWPDVCWYANAQLFVAAGSVGIMTSPDGVTWTARSGPTTLISIACNSSIIVAIRSGSTTYYTSADGVTWSSQTTPNVSTSPGSIAVDPYGRFLFTYHLTTAYWSTNGLTWTATTLPSTAASGGSNKIAAANSIRWAYISGNANSTAAAYSSPTITTNSLSPTSSGLQFSAQDNGSNAPNSQLMIKNATQAWTLNTSDTLTQITDVDYPGQYTVTLTSLTRSGTTATATTATDTNFQVGSTVTIAGATPSGYNGAVTITGITASSTADSSDIAITITRSGTTATATTVSEPHGFTNGQNVTISGADQSEYNGTFAITWISATSFSFTVTVTGVDVTSPAGGSPILSYIRFSGQSWNYAGTWLSPTPLIGGSYTNFRFQTAFSAPHGLVNGSTVNIPAYGNVVISNVTTTTFDFTVSGVATQALDANGCTLISTKPTISSITYANGIATVTFTGAHNFFSYQAPIISISGATPTPYNVNAPSYSITSSTTITFPLSGGVASPVTPATGTIVANSKSQLPVGASFTYAVVNTLATPATGTITAAGGRNTVPGIAYLDGYFVVMDVNGVLSNSAEDDPSIWNALEYVTALAETGAGKAIARSLNYIVAFKEWSTELWWNAGNPPPGSPLGPVDDGLILVGCASGDSVTPLDGAIYWLSQVRQRGKSVHVIQGRTVQKVSTPDVERILNADDLATVRAAAWKVDGHPIYLLTLETSNLTLAYDSQSNTWGIWSSYTLNGFSVSVSSITRSGTTATVTTAAAHGLSDGDPVKIAGASQSDYNGVFQAFVTSTTTFTIEVANSPTTPATGTITATAYTESYFKFTKYTDANGVDVVLHETDGHLYQVSSSTYQDNGIPINRFVRTIRLDGGSENYKTMPLIRMVADKGTGTPAVRWSDDDSATFVAYRKLDLSLSRPEARRCGKFLRRTVEFRDLSNTGERWEAAEIEIGGQ